MAAVLLERSVVKRAFPLEMFSVCSYTGLTARGDKVRLEIQGSAMTGTAGEPLVSPDAPLGHDALVQFRVAHLTMLQAVIGRMAGYSSSVKNFAVTIAAASLAVAFDKATELPLWIALGAALLLGALDAYYLFKEKGFRATYERVVGEPLSKAGELAIKPDPASFRGALASVSIWLFYLPLLGIVGWLIWKGVPQ
tara:strand:+ start:774 stop:1358 length:585 start_codon:yes stop_codon:yes gene_type:complete